CIPQPGSGALLDSLSDRIMFRVAYRNQGTHESLIANHSVQTSVASAVRWYELRDPAGTPSVYQQGTFDPGDGASRWMGSAAMDGAGNIALGYSISSSTRHPAIGFTGHAAATDA